MKVSNKIGDIIATTSGMYLVASVGYDDAFVCEYIGDVNPINEDAVKAILTKASSSQSDRDALMSVNLFEGQYTLIRTHNKFKPAIELGDKVQVKGATRPNDPTGTLERLYYVGADVLFIGALNPVYVKEPVLFTGSTVCEKLAGIPFNIVRSGEIWKRGDLTIKRIAVGPGLAPIYWFYISTYAGCKVGQGRSVEECIKKTEQLFKALCRKTIRQMTKVRRAR